MHATTTTPATTQLPALAEWKSYYVNGKQNSYDIEQDGVKYSIQPLFHANGRIRGYHLGAFGHGSLPGHATVEPLVWNGKMAVTLYPFIGYGVYFARAASAAKAARLAHAKRPQ